MKKASTAGLIALVLAGLASTARAERASAQMSVSVTVVRSCAVGGAVNGSVTLACSNGVTHVAVGDGNAPPVQVLSGGSPTNLGPSSSPTQPPAAPTAQPGKVTINF